MSDTACAQLTATSRASRSQLEEICELDDIATNLAPNDGTKSRTKTAGNERSFGSVRHAL
jgi:hypothetical protein